MNNEQNDYSNDFLESLDGITLQDVPPVAYTGEDLENLATLIEGKDLGMLNRKEWAAVYSKKRGSQLANNLRAHMKALKIKGTVSESNGGYGTTVTIKFAADEEAANAMILRHSLGYWDGQNDCYHDSGDVFAREFGGSYHIRVKVIEEKIEAIEEPNANDAFTYEQIHGCTQEQAKEKAKEKATDDMERKGLALGLVKVSPEEMDSHNHKNGLLYNLKRELKAAGIKATVAWSSYPIITVQEPHRVASAEKLAAKHMRDYCAPLGTNPWADLFGGVRFIRVDCKA